MPWVAKLLSRIDMITDVKSCQKYILQRDWRDFDPIKTVTGSSSRSGNSTRHLVLATSSIERNKHEARELHLAVG